MNYEIFRNKKVLIGSMLVIAAAIIWWSYSAYSNRNQMITNPSTEDIKGAMTIPQGERVDLTEAKKQEVLNKMAPAKEATTTKQEEEDIFKAMGGK